MRSLSPAASRPRFLAGNLCELVRKTSRAVLLVCRQLLRSLGPSPLPHSSRCLLCALWPIVCVELYLPPTLCVSVFVLACAVSVGVCVCVGLLLCDLISVSVFVAAFLSVSVALFVSVFVHVSVHVAVSMSVAVVCVFVCVELSRKRRSS